MPEAPWLVVPRAGWSKAWRTRTTGGCHQEPRHQDGVPVGTPEVGAWPVIAHTGQREFPASQPGRTDECMTSCPFCSGGCHHRLPAIMPQAWIGDVSPDLLSGLIPAPGPIPDLASCSSFFKNRLQTQWVRHQTHQVRHQLRKFDARPSGSIVRPNRSNTRPAFLSLDLAGPTTDLVGLTKDPIGPGLDLPGLTPKLMVRRRA